MKTAIVHVDSILFCCSDFIHLSETGFATSGPLLCTIAHMQLQMYLHGFTNFTMQWTAVPARAARPTMWMWFPSPLQLNNFQCSHKEAPLSSHLMTHSLGSYDPHVKCPRKRKLVSCLKALGSYCGWYHKTGDHSPWSSHCHLCYYSVSLSLSVSLNICTAGPTWLSLAIPKTQVSKLVVYAQLVFSFIFTFYIDDWSHYGALCDSQ